MSFAFAKSRKKITSSTFAEEIQEMTPYKMNASEIGTKQANTRGPNI